MPKESTFNRDLVRSIEEAAAEQVAAVRLDEQQAQAQELRDTKATRAWGDSPHDAVEEGTYLERLGATRKVFVDAYVLGYQQAQMEHAVKGSHLSFGDALAIRSAVEDMIMKSNQSKHAADMVQAALDHLIKR